MPPTSDLNWSAGETVSNATVVGLGSSSGITATTEISSTDVIVDVFGWYG